MTQRDDIRADVSWSRLRRHAPLPTLRRHMEVRVPATPREAGAPRPRVSVHAAGAVQTVLGIHDEHLEGATGETVRFADVIDVFEMAANEFAELSEVIRVRPVHICTLEDVETMIALLLHLVHLLQKLSKNADDELRFRRTVHRVISLKVRTRTGCTILHCAVDTQMSTVADEFFSSFPDVDVVRLLLECGSPVNDVDDENNTPLHLCAMALRDAVGAPLSLENKFLSVCRHLVTHGAHIDAKNKKRVSAIHMLPQSMLLLDTMKFTTLKCLAARAIRHHQVEYTGQVPEALVPFVEMH